MFAYRPRMHAYTTPRHILVPHDFSATAEAALSYATALALKLGARITVLNVYELPSYGYGEALGFTAEILSDIQRASEEGVKIAADRARSAGVEVNDAVRQGPAWSEIDAAANELGVDLIVMGTHGRKGLSRAFLGSVAEKVVRTAPCPVLAVRGGNESAA
jgi:nucleotide-binding universal stress UspA family protein